MGTSKHTSYTQALVTLQESLQQISEQMQQQQPRPLDGIQATLVAVNDRQKEMLQILKDMNGRVRVHGELLAKHNQWIEDHVTATHTALGKDVESLKSQNTVVKIVEGALVIVAGWLGISKITG